MTSILRKQIPLWLGLTFIATPGCVTLDLDSARTLARLTSFGDEAGVEVRKTPQTPLHERLNLLGWGGPTPTERTNQLLRRYDLEEAYKDDAAKTLLSLNQRQEVEGDLELLHALAELSYIEGRKKLKRKDSEAAKDMFGSTMAYAYRYLFSNRYQRQRNVYDPEFRSVSDLYNGALEDLLRQLQKEGNLRPGYMASLNAIGKRLDFTIAIKGPWHANEFERFEFVSDYEVTGLNNTYQTFGLGVPLIAVRRQHENESPDEKFYPKGLTFSVTAFFRVLNDDTQDDTTGQPGEFCAVELHDPLSDTALQLGSTEVPLESDITTPMAYYLNDPLVSSRTVATLALLNAEFGKNFRGLYMLEPYDPNRIPVVMVHGLWSSPVTWMEMFNDLRGLPEIRENYQFWFYMYPTGQPFWISAQQMREDLAEAQVTFDPQRDSQTMSQMVLVGHSMGGLVSRLQTMYSEDDFWNVMTDEPFESLEGDPLTREQMRSVWFFEPNPAIRRVITIGTPHRGSEFANSTTRWLSHRFFKLPRFITLGGQRVLRDNPRYFDNTELLTINTSIDSLSPKSPILPVMMEAEVAPWVNYHNIVGVNPSTNMLANLGISKKREGDGVVSLASASMQDWNSQVQVPAAHTKIHQHPRAILEVRRILLEHLAHVDHDRTWDPAIRPAAGESSLSPSSEPTTSPYRLRSDFDVNPAGLTTPLQTQPEKAMTSEPPSPGATEPATPLVLSQTNTDGAETSSRPADNPSSEPAELNVVEDNQSAPVESPNQEQAPESKEVQSKPVPILSGIEPPQSPNHGVHLGSSPGEDQQSKDGQLNLEAELSDSVSRHSELATLIVDEHQAPERSASAVATKIGSDPILPPVASEHGPRGRLGISPSLTGQSSSSQEVSGQDGLNSNSEPKTSEFVLPDTDWSFPELNFPAPPSSSLEDLKLPAKWWFDLEEKLPTQSPPEAASMPLRSSRRQPPQGESALSSNGFTAK